MLRPGGNGAQVSSSGKEKAMERKQKKYRLHRPPRTVASPEQLTEGAVSLDLEFFDQKKEEIGGLQGVLQGIVGEEGWQIVEFA